MVKTLAALLLFAWALPAFAAELPQAQVTPERNPSAVELKVDELSAKQAELSGEILTIKGSARWLSEKINLVSKDVTAEKKAVELLEPEFRKAQEDLDKALKQSVSFADEIDTLKTKLNYLEDESKVRTDDLKSLRENIAALKNSVDGNTESLVDCRKSYQQLREDLNKCNRLSNEDPVSWPYWGVAGTAVGVLALILAIVK